jgi:hypothetical protein
LSSVTARPPLAFFAAHKLATSLFSFILFPGSVPGLPVTAGLSLVPRLDIPSSEGRRQGQHPLGCPNSSRRFLSHSLLPSTGAKLAGCFSG